GQYEEATIASLSGYFVRACERLLSDVDASHGYSLLSAAERERLQAFNATMRDFPRNVRIHELFEAQARKNPEAIALVFEDRSLSYRELDIQANRLAHYLRDERGVSHGDLVGICMERSLDMVVGILGALKAGAAYVPLDPGYPKQRLEHMLSDSGMTSVLVQRHLQETVLVGNGQAVPLDSPATRQALERHRSDAPSIVDAGADDLAYVIYTSGSTGLPKGVLVEHRALVNRIDWMHREYGADSGDVFLQKTPFGFDVSVWEFMWPLVAGSRLVMARPDGHKDPSYLAEVIAAERVTKLHFVPSMLSVMLESGLLGGCGTLAQVFCSGEALAPHHVRSFFDQCPWSQLHNLYGPTEAAIDVSHWNCADTEVGTANVPIGRPIQNIQLHVLGENGDCIPCGAVGELCIAGVGLARGYLNRPDLTREKFVVNPFYDDTESSSSRRMYRTGDLARWRQDGTLEFLGRIDHQVKIRGFRVELGEIEAVLATCTGVVEVTVVVREVVGDQRLVAYFTGTADGASLRALLGDRLPEYMIPSAFVHMEVMPLSPNGKVDRRALPDPVVAALKGERVPPQTPREAEVLGIFAELLKLDPDSISIDSGFFDLGGHSLLLMRLQARMSEAFGVDVDIRRLYEKQSVQAIALAVDADIKGRSLAHELASLREEDVEEAEF
ncbi:amino acid adenylation domain-containing protein, partial [Lysobacter maris]